MHFDVSEAVSEALTNADDFSFIVRGRIMRKASVVSTAIEISYITL